MTEGDSRPLGAGHRWRVCSSCGRWATSTQEGSRCKQTATKATVRQRDDGTTAVAWSCPGKLYAQDAPADEGEGVCGREGCGNVARVTTALGERVCWRCLRALAGA